MRDRKTRYSFLQFALATASSLSILPACADSVVCSPGPLLDGSAPADATVGFEYQACFTSRYIRSFFPIPLTGTDIVLESGPKGAFVLLPDCVRWTPKEEDLERTFALRIKTPPDACG